MEVMEYLLVCFNAAGEIVSHEQYAYEAVAVERCEALRKRAEVTESQYTYKVAEIAY
jgi:hypothetical protein